LIAAGESTGPGIAQLSSERQISDLQWLLAKPRLSKASQIAMTRLVDLLQTDASVVLRALPVISFSRASMNDVPEGELPLFINDYALGFGNEEAAVVIMGSEEAYEPTRDNLAAWNCTCAVRAALRLRPAAASCDRRSLAA
jgi:hypothetical protein